MKIKSENEKLNFNALNVVAINKNVQTVFLCACANVCLVLVSVSPLGEGSEYLYLGCNGSAGILHPVTEARNWIRVHSQLSRVVNSERGLLL